jgi:hypothetical protein
MEVHMKKSFLTSLSLVVFAASVSFAHANNGGLPPGARVVTEPNDKTAADSSAEYVLEATLSNEDGRGTVQVSKRQDDGTYAIVPGLSTEDCPARGSHKMQISSHRVKTPQGLQPVVGSAKYAVFQGEYEANMPWGTFFNAVNDNPIGVHTGPLDSISHACIRVPVDCAHGIYNLVNVEGNTNNARPSFLPDEASGKPRTVKPGVMDVVVKWVN